MSIYVNSRFDNAIVYLDGDSGIQYLDPIYTAKYEAEKDDLIIIVQEGQRLDNIANELYGDPQLEWILMDANPELSTPFDIRPGMRLNAPDPERVISNA